MIVLNGYTYKTIADSYRPIIERQGETRITINATVDKTESKKTSTRWSLSVLCPKFHDGTIGGLDTLIIARYYNGPLLFEEESGLSLTDWMASEETNPLFFFGTNVYIENMSYINIGPILSTTIYKVDIQLIGTRAS